MPSFEKSGYLGGSFLVITGDRTAIIRESVLNGPAGAGEEA
jgi:hypothetical protein